MVFQVTGLLLDGEDYENPLVSLNKALLGPYFLGWPWGGWIFTFQQRLMDVKSSLPAVEPVELVQLYGPTWIFVATSFRQISQCSCSADFAVFFFPSQVFINFSEAINRWLNLRTFKKNMCGGITWVYWFHTPQQSGKLHLHPAPWVHLMVKKLYIFHSYSPFPYVTRFLPPLIENTKLLMWTSDTTSSFRSKKNCQLMKLKT